MASPASSSRTPLDCLPGPEVDGLGIERYLDHIGGKTVSEPAIDRTLGCPEPREGLIVGTRIIEVSNHQPAKHPAAAVRRLHGDHCRCRHGKRRSAWDGHIELEARECADDVVTLERDAGPIERHLVEEPSLVLCVVRLEIETEGTHEARSE